MKKKLVNFLKNNVETLIQFFFFFRKFANTKKHPRDHTPNPKFNDHTAPTHLKRKKISPYPEKILPQRNKKHRESAHQPAATAPQSRLGTYPRLSHSPAGASRPHAFNLKVSRSPHLIKKKKAPTHLYPFVRYTQRPAEGQQCSYFPSLACLPRCCSLSLSLTPPAVFPFGSLLCYMSHTPRTCVLHYIFFSLFLSFSFSPLLTVLSTQQHCVAPCRYSCPPLSTCVYPADAGMKRVGGFFRTRAFYGCTYVCIYASR